MQSTVENLRYLELHVSQFLHEHVDDGTDLWIVNKGFRFPYTTTRENLKENMHWLELQLQHYLHEHVDDGTALWVVNKAFRFPNQNWDEEWAIAENMKHLEIEVSDHLHRHYAVVVEE